MAEMMSIGIVGTGWAGSSVAISTLHNAAAMRCCCTGVGEVIAPDPGDPEHTALGHSAEDLHKAIAAVAPEQ